MSSARTPVTRVDTSPDRTLVKRVHTTALGAVVGPGEVQRVGERPQHTDRSRTVDRRPQVVQGFLVSNLAAPDLNTHTHTHTHTHTNTHTHTHTHTHTYTHTPHTDSV